MGVKEVNNKISVREVFEPLTKSIISSQENSLVNNKTMVVK